MDPDLLRLLDEAQARQLPALIAEWASAGGERRWIARALKVDLALLTERPELAVPCVYRRCAFVDSAEETGFYLRRAQLPHDMTALRGTVRRWAEQWGPGRRWLRALRPPPVPVDGALVEEYRTGVFGRMWVSEDGERIGVAGNEAHVAWERATGRRIDGAQSRPVEEASIAPWELAHESSWGRAIVERGDVRIDLEISSNEIVRGARTLSDDYVLLAGDDLDQEDFYSLLDTRKARILWRQSATLKSARMLDADTLLVGHAFGIDWISIETGNEITSWRCPFVTNVIAISDGSVATHAGNVVRVWRPDPARPEVTHPSMNSWTDAEFSPDGKHLLTGRLLCDASGKLVASIDCNGPSGWLHGGPPRACQRICNGVIAEILPFHMSVWSAHDGSLLVRDRDRRAHHGDLVAFDPLGRYHAIWSERGVLQIFHMRAGTLVRELEQRVTDRFGDRRLGFSADGSLLAWENVEGERFAIAMDATDEVRRLFSDEEPFEMPPAKATIEDALLVVGEAAIPIDDSAAVVSPDGRQFASPQSHYLLEA